MHLSTYDLVYSIMNIFGTYIVYRFMNVFFDRTTTNKRIELITYISYFFVITITYLYINIPVVMMVCNIIAFIGLSFNYEASIKKRLLSVVLIYLILMCIEMIVVLVSGYFDFPILTKNAYSSSLGIINIKILSYIVVLIINNYKNIRRGEIVPTSYWFCIFLMPIASLYIILIIFQAKGLRVVQVIMCIVFLLLINFATFQLYDVIIAALSDKMEKKLLTQQNRYYDKQFQLMKTSVKTMGTIKHDLRNHLLVLQSLANNHEKDKLTEHIATMISVCEEQKDYAHSGNILFDSILNFKLQEAEQKGITINFDLNVPEEINIASFDMAIILGNLVDNAIQAVEELKENKIVVIKIRYDKGRLFMKIENPFNGRLKKDSGKIVTSKQDSENHGIGLESIRLAIQKYDGTLDINCNNNVFSASLLMFID